MDYDQIRLMKNISNYLDGGFNDPPIQVVCPICECNGVHGGKSVESVHGKTIWHLTPYFCECGHEWVEYIYEHKGDVCKGKFIVDREKQEATTLDYFADLHKCRA